MSYHRHSSLQCLSPRLVASFRARITTFTMPNSTKRKSAKSSPKKKSGISISCYIIAPVISNFHQWADSACLSESTVEKLTSTGFNSLRAVALIRNQDIVLLLAKQKEMYPMKSSAPGLTIKPRRLVLQCTPFLPIAVPYVTISPVHYHNCTAGSKWCIQQYSLPFVECLVKYRGEHCLRLLADVLS